MNIGLAPDKIRTSSGRAPNKLRTKAEKNGARTIHTDKKNW